MIADADMTEPYEWTPTNSVEVIAFANYVRGLTDQTATLTLTDDPATVAPSFADDTGNAQTWEMGTAIAAITVPEADGTPTPTYAVEGSLPAGIAFDTVTRVISGTPTATGTARLRFAPPTQQAMPIGRWTTPSVRLRLPRPALLLRTLTVDSDTQITAVGVAPNDGGDTITSYDWATPYHVAAGGLGQPQQCIQLDPGIHRTRGGADIPFPVPRNQLSRG